jgi:hypothetical protein
MIAVREEASMQFERLIDVLKAGERRPGAESARRTTAR